MNDERLILRKADRSDVDLIYKWAVDPTVRANSFNRDDIAYEDHVAWFDKMLDDPDRIMYILVKDNTPIGQIRFDIEGDKAEISYSIASEFRGCGYGRTIIRLAKEMISEQCPDIRQLIARVKPDNAASHSVFRAEGFEEKYSCYTIETDTGKRRGN